MVQNGRLPGNAEPGRKRQMRSKLERRQVVEETMRPGAPSVAVIARAHGMNANQVFNWRKLFTRGDSMIRSRQLSYCRSESQKTHALSMSARNGPSLPPWLRA